MDNASQAAKNSDAGTLAHSVGNPNVVAVEKEGVSTATAYEVFHIVMHEAWELREEIEEFLELLILKEGYPWVRCLLYTWKQTLPRINNVFRLCAKYRSGIKVRKQVYVPSSHYVNPRKKRVQRSSHMKEGNHVVTKGPKNEDFTLISSDSE